MPTSVTPYFLLELNALNERVDINVKEIESLKTKLLGIIQRDGIVELSEQAETLLTLLDDVEQLFNLTHKEIIKQQDAIKDDQTLVNSHTRDSALRTKQDAIRLRMLENEKNFLDVKYSCLQFFAKVL